MVRRPSGFALGRSIEYSLWEVDGMWWPTHGVKLTAGLGGFGSSSEGMRLGLYDGEGGSSCQMFEAEGTMQGEGDRSSRRTNNVEGHSTSHTAKGVSGVGEPVSGVDE